MKKPSAKEKAKEEAKGKAGQQAEDSFRITTDAFGIDDRYVDVKGKVHAVSPVTRAALLAAMGIDPDRPGDVPVAEATGTHADVIVLRGERLFAPGRAGDLVLEDGSRQALASSGAVELPLGYHDFFADDSRPAGKPIRIIVAPRHCHLPDDLRLWGWAAQLYATRSRESWGIGDLADLRRLAEWSRGLGAGAIMINPLSAVSPILPVEASPYFPSSRRFRNPVYLRVEEVPGAQALGDLLPRLAASGRGLNARRRVDRDAVFALKMQALEACFAGWQGSDSFARYRGEQGEALRAFSTFCAISETQGKDWRQWPRELRHPSAPGVAAFAERSARRVMFHSWVQWLLDEQLAAAARDVRIVQDLPIGLDIGGADAWCWQDLLAQGVSVGAPPDEYNPPGQDWGLTPFIPHRLRGVGYQPLIETIRATARHAGGLRIDHVMGLFHLYWIPRDPGGAANGGFVRTRADELLSIIALESQRARAFVVGEDLGTVEAGVRETMADHKMLSYRLLYFEAQPPAAYPELALSTVTTHDLPTIAGLASGADLRRAKAAGAEQNEDGLRALHDKLVQLAGVAPGAQPDELVREVHAALATAPSRVLLASLDDALAVEERPNIPGAAEDWPNWSVALPLPLEDFGDLELPRQIARLLGERRGADRFPGPAPGADAATSCDSRSGTIEG
jgi:4-alpha-glucanotransferase